MPCSHGWNASIELAEAQVGVLSVQGILYCMYRPQLSLSSGPHHNRQMLERSILRVPANCDLSRAALCCSSPSRSLLSAYCGCSNAVLGELVKRFAEHKRHCRYQHGTGTP